MNNLRQLIWTTLIGGALFLIPLVFVVVVFGKWNPGTRRTFRAW